MKLKPSCIIVLFASATLSHAGSIGTVTNESGWTFDFGSRYWLSTNSYTKTIYDIDGTTLVSRLSYENTVGNSAEGFWQLVHNSGLFVKGYFGGGSITNGKMYDEDFPPVTNSYSNTSQQQKNGSLNYLSADLGYRLLGHSNWQIGVFLGYHYWSEYLNTFGCVAQAGNESCSNIPTSTDTLDNKATWSSLRIGATSTIPLNHQLNFNTDIAYVRSHLNAQDFHNLRPEIRGIFDNGVGNGVQIDGIINWAVTHDWSLGAGARWWHVATNGFMHFDQTAGGGQPQPIEVTQDSYGLLVQTNYQFDNLAHSTHSVSPSWAGTYIGANIGYGTNQEIVYINPTSADAMSLLYTMHSPLNLNVQNAGFLGGGQLGYNWLMNQWLAGIEADISYAHISGANAVTLGNPDPDEYTLMTTTVTTNLNWLATVRGRFGTLAADNVMVYLTAGPAFGRTNLGFDQRSQIDNCSASCSTGSNSKNKTGWTTGVGAEYAVSQQATFKVEYLYVDFGNNVLNSISSSPDNPTYAVKTAFNNNILRLGLNYKI